jgi:penicillin-binding protein 1A
LGQGANTGLPIWADFVRRCYEDKKLNFDKDMRFKEPSTPVNIETDCNKYKAANPSQHFNKIFD